MLAVEWFQRNKQHGLEMSTTNKHNWFHIVLYYTLAALIIAYAGEEQAFIYFQF